MWVRAVTNPLTSSSVHHLLVIDDDLKLRNLLRQFLGVKGFLVSCAASLDEARVALDLFSIDLVLLDVLLSGEEGFAFFSWPDPKPPVIFLTARGGVEDRLSGLSMGAYDYLPKPFEPEELFLRIHSILRRVPQRGRDDIVLGDFAFDPGQNLLKKGRHQRVVLTENEKQLFQVFLDHKNKPVSRALLADILGVELSRAIDVRIGRLRAKVDQVSDGSCLQSVRGVGYVLRVAD